MATKKDDGQPHQSRTLFVALSGPPNVGKSSILNSLLGVKVAGVSRKPQTTRNSIRGIVTEGDAQIVFIDSPGFLTPKAELEKKIVKTAAQTVQDADLVCIVIDAKKGIEPRTEELFSKCKELKKDTIVVINKIDTVKQHLLPPLAQNAFDKGGIKDILFTSCSNGKGVQQLKKYLLDNAKPDHWHYEPNYSTDRNINFVASEITREKLFGMLHQEVPYSIDVITIDIHKQKDGPVIIKQEVLTTKEAHKGIVIGPNGRTLKEASRRAVEDLEKIIKDRVALSISVRVKTDWMRDWESS